MESSDPPDSRNLVSRIRSRATSFRQQSTTKSADKPARGYTSKRAESFKFQAKREAAQPKKCQERVDSYHEGLKWEVLHKFLLQKWPNEDFKGERRDDSWVFDAPEPLTEEDRRAITKLRDNGMAQSSDLRKSVTPE
ncbi:hypothetical protein F4781DRAFT_434491 [Annulohypoxylon bovei var. microspora]|nr:hypothetical protein F4781DRAFT_434491 [Annulohypoxylon bovei var. microspora]